jgi:hypothetical protein
VNGRLGSRERGYRAAMALLHATGDVGVLELFEQPGGR